MRIAYFSPLNPSRSGISDYSEELLPYLAKYADIDIFTDDNYLPSNKNIIDRFSVHKYTDYDALRDRYDIPLYQLGNHPFHAYIYDTLIKYPGITVLHELVFHHLIKWISKGKPARYIREMGYCLGISGAEKARKILAENTCQEYKYPLFNRIVDSSLGVITHSHYVKNAVLNYSPRMPAKVIEQHFKEIDVPYLPAKAKKDLGLGAHKLIILSAGIIAPQKRIDVCLKAFSRLQIDFPNSIYILLGECIENYDVRKMIKDLHLNDKVIMTGHVSLKDFYKYILASDICVNLRHPSAGETSASARRIMGAGKPIIVSDADWFSEIPDNCCIKIDTGKDEEGQLLKALRLLASNKSVRQELGGNARNYSLRYCNIQLSAHKYIDFINEILSLPLPISGKQNSGIFHPEKDHIERIVLAGLDMGIDPGIKNLLLSVVEGLTI